MKRNSSGISRKGTILIILMVILLFASSVAVPMFAKYLKRTEELKNTFSHVDTTGPTIEESFDGTTWKRDVAVSVGETDYPVFVRATIVITWKKQEIVKDENGNAMKDENGSDVTKDVVYFQRPVEGRGNDYVLNLNLGKGWEYNEDDGFYYYTLPVKSGETTSVLITSCERLETAQPPEEGYVLSVEIIAQTVQAVGYKDEPDDEIPAYQDAWSIADFSSWNTTTEPTGETTTPGGTAQGD